MSTKAYDMNIVTRRLWLAVTRSEPETDQTGVERVALLLARFFAEPLLFSLLLQEAFVLLQRDLRIIQSWLCLFLLV